MTDRSSSEGHEQNLAVLEPTTEPQSEFGRTVDKLCALEHQRIESVNRRTDVALKAIEATEAADKRQFEYHLEKLRTSVQERSENRRSVLKLVWMIGGVLIFVTAFILLMSFFGSDTQQDVAMTILRTVATGLGGAGVIWMLRALLVRAMKENRND